MSGNKKFPRTHAGRLAAEILDALADMVKPGVTTGALDDAIRGMMLDAGAIPATLPTGIRTILPPEKPSTSASTSTG